MRLQIIAGNMEILAHKGDLLEEKCDLLVLNVFESDEGLKSDAEYVDQGLEGLLSSVIKEEHFKAKADQVLMVRTNSKVPAKRVLLVGLGQEEEFKLETARDAAARAFETIKKLGVKRVCSVLHGIEFEDLGARDLGQAMAEGVLLAAYQFDKFKKMNGIKLEEFVIVTDTVAQARQAEQGIELGKVMAAGAIYARDLVNTPGQYLKPIDMVESARAIAKDSKGAIKVKVMNQEQLERMKAGALLGIAQGSHAEPYMVHLKYHPEGAKKKISLVGKAVTFDSGGLQIKSHKGMTVLGTMKVDMAGAATVLGIFSVLKELKPKIAIDGIFGACENMVSGNAIRPGDVVTAMDGKSIEIIHTDAEGRVTLADSLTYAVRQKPDAIISMATLTMSIIYALGEHYSGVFGNDKNLIAKIFEASKKTGEDMWEMPLDQRYKKTLKSKIADINNSGGRDAGPTKAALFLEAFVQNTPWAFIDIGGPTFAEKPINGYWQYGATGVGVRTMLELIRKY